MQRCFKCQTQLSQEEKKSLRFSAIITGASSFLAHPHWIRACFTMICGPKAMQQLLAGLIQALEHAIQSDVKHPKQPKIAHPRVRNGRNWRRIRNRTRWLHKQCVQIHEGFDWLHKFVQHAKPRQTNYSDTHARKSDEEHCMHKEDMQVHKTETMHNDTNLWTIKVMQANQHSIADLQPMRANTKTEQAGGKL